MKVAAESTVEAAAGEEVLAVRRAFGSRVSRWSRDSPPASGPGSGLRARRLDPRSLEVCDIEEERAWGPRAVVPRKLWKLILQFLYQETRKL